MQYIASLSYGKDSLAMIHVIRDVLDWPLDRIITAEVWATDTIPADLPPMVEFKAKADEIIRERWGIEVEHFCAQLPQGKKTYETSFYKKNESGKFTGANKGFPMTTGAWCKKLKLEAIQEAKKTYESVFYRTFQNSRTESKNGQIYGFPIPLGNWCTAELKTSALDAAKKTMRDSMSYIGIAADEKIRVERHKDKDGVKLPLFEAGWTEQMCREWCEENGLLSPIYTTASRGGCWFCHNQSISQLRILRHDYPELWALLLK